VNRAMRRASEKNGRVLQGRPWNAFQDVTVEANLRHAILNKNSMHFPQQVFQNNKYVVQVFRGLEILGMKADKVMIRRSDSQPIHSWADLQRIKNEIFGDEKTAIEVYPPQDELTDVANLYWLWVLK